MDVLKKLAKPGRQETIRAMNISTILTPPNTPKTNIVLAKDLNLFSCML